MGYGRALLQRDVRQEEASFRKKAKKKSLWGSIGRTLGGLGAMALTGGLVNPVTLGLLTGGATYLGGAIGAKASKTGDLSKGKFFKSDRKSAQKELGAFGTQNLMSSLTSGLTAGIGQKLKLMKSGKTAAKLSDKGFGLDFKGSMVGKGLAKRAAGKELSTMRGWQGQYESLEAAKKSKLSTMRGWEGQYEKEKLLSSRPTKPSVSLDLEESFKMPFEQGKDIEQFSEFGKYGAMEESLQGDKMFSNWQSPPQAVGESFSVSSPDFISQEFGSAKVREIGASQYSAGKSAILDTERHKGMQDMMNLQNRFSNRSWDRSFRK